MRYREIKKYHITAIISGITLLFGDILAFYLAYGITEYNFGDYVGIKYPIRLMIIIIVLIYIFKRYNPAPAISRGYEVKILIQLFYFVGIGYVFYKILSGSFYIDKAQYDLVFLHIFIFLNILFRLSIRSIHRYFLKKGFGGRRTIIIGRSKDAYHIANEINRNPSLGFILIGYFNKIKSQNMERYCTYLGKPEEIESYIVPHNIHEVIIALDKHKHDELLNIIGKFNSYDVSIKVVPDMYEAISGQVRIDTIRGLPLLDINPDIMTEFQEVFKRLGDICLSIIGLILLLPINLLIALIICIDSSGGVFYKQVRVGLNGVRFTLIKFRTMFSNSEDETGPVWAEKGDSRITGIGKILRKYHLDEIPQLLNVLYGHMSIAGPRPERPEIIDSLLMEFPYYARRFKMKPGLTGWAQIMGAYDCSVADVRAKLKHDFYYIENMSILLDMKIIFATFFIIIKGKGQ